MGNTAIKLEKRYYHDRGLLEAVVLRFSREPIAMKVDTEIINDSAGQATLVLSTSELLVESSEDRLHDALDEASQLIEGYIQIAYDHMWMYPIFQ